MNPGVSTTLVLAALAAAVLLATGRIKSGFLWSLGSALFLATLLIPTLLCACGGLLPVMPLGALVGGLALRSWWWPLLCPLPALGVVAWQLWPVLNPPPPWPGPLPPDRAAAVVPEHDGGLDRELMVFASEVLLAALVLVGLAALGVALGRRFWPPAT